VAAPLLIRDARLEELDTIVALLLAAYQQYADVLPPAAWEAYARDIANVRGRLPESELIVAETGGRIIGTVTFYPVYAGMAEAGSRTARAGFRLLAVHPEARGHGVGRRLVEECIRRARQRGAAVLVLHTAEMMTVAKGLYERMGFVRAPELDIVPAPGVVIMGYRLEL
jgi:GNAT superfamily N-acetyltransferase